MEANRNSKPVDAPTIKVRITPTVERDYKRRDVFPTLRIERAERVVSGSVGDFTLLLEMASEVMADAQTQYSARGGRESRGLKVAFGFLYDNLKGAIEREQRRGLWDDPGYEIVSARMKETPAQLQPGQAVRYWSEWTDDPDDGMQLEIVKGYALYSVDAHDGPFIDKDGNRREYRWGYVARTRLGESTFVAANNLRSMENKIEHLKLVK